MSIGIGRKGALPTDLFEGVACSASLVCLVHCAAPPLMLLLLPSIAEAFILPESFHAIALMLIVPAGAAALWPAYLCHRNLAPAALAGLGTACLAAALLPALERGEVPITVAGSLALITAHVMNWRLRVRCAG